MANELKHLLIGVIIITLFSFLIIFGASQLGGEYDKDVSKLEEGSLNLTYMNKTLQGAQETAEDWRETFQSDNLAHYIYGVLVGIFKVALNMFSWVVAPAILFIQLGNDILGIPPMITGTLIFILIVSVILAIWSLRKKGD